MADDLGPSYLEILETRLAGKPLWSEGGEEGDEDEIETVEEAQESFSRVIVAAVVSDTLNNEDVIDFHEVFLQNNALPGSMKTTGVLFAQDECFLHVIETTLDVSENYFNLLDQKQKEGALSEVRIIHMAEDCPTQLFPKWFNYGDVIGAPEPGGVDLRGEGGAGPAAADLMRKLYDVADVLAKSPNTDLKRRHLHLVPSAARVAAFARAAEFPDPPAHFAAHAAPADLDLEGERVWPLQPVVDYYD